MLTLYTYFRSSAAYRVRIALNLKGLAYTAIPVHLLRDGGQQNHAGYRTLSPLGTVPTLSNDEAQAQNLTLTQSLAIIEYLDEIQPKPPLLPASAAERARVRALALTIACDIHPINNLRILNYLGNELGASAAQKDAWYRHWINTGLQAIEALLAKHPQTGTYCHGDTPGLADCCLVPQVFNARRYHCPLDTLPTITRIVTACNALPAFAQAAPEQQADAE